MQPDDRQEAEHQRDVGADQRAGGAALPGQVHDQTDQHRGQGGRGGDQELIRVVSQRSAKGM